MPTISRVAFAASVGVTEGAIRRAIREGRLTLADDGKLDPVIALQQWRATSMRLPPESRPQPMARPAPAVAPDRPAPKPSAPAEQSGPAFVSEERSAATFNQARTANEVLRAKLLDIRFKREKGELIDRANTIKKVFALARAERDAWMNWPTRIVDEMAAQLRVNARDLHRLMDVAVRAHLEERGSVEITIN